MANAKTNEQNIKHLHSCIEELAKHIADQFQRINTISSGNPEFNINHLKTTVKSNLIAAINSLVTVKNDQVIINAARNFLEEDNCKDIIFRAQSNITMTVPEFATERFSCGMYNEGPGEITFAKSNGSVVLDLPDGSVLPAKKVATLFKILNENNQIIKGELVTPTP